MFYKLQITVTKVPIDLPPFCPPPTPVQGTILQEVLPCQLCWGFCNPQVSCYGPGPFLVNRDIGMDHWNQQPWHQQNQNYNHYREPSSGPSRPQRHSQRLREAEYPYPIHNVHDFSRTFVGGSADVYDPGMAGIDGKKTGGSKVWRTPPMKPIDN